MSDPTQEQVDALCKQLFGLSLSESARIAIEEKERKTKDLREGAEKLGRIRESARLKPTIDKLKTAVRQTHAEFLKVFSEDHVPEKLQKTYSLFHKLNNCQSVALELTRYEHRKKPLSRQAVHKRLLQLDRITEGKLCIAEQLKRTRLSEQAKRTESRRIEDERRDKVAKRY